MSTPAPNVDIDMTSTVGTEDDTFRILSRPSIHEMVVLHRDWKRKFTDEGKEFNTMWNISFMRSYGWDWTEFLIEKNKRGYPTF